MENQPIFEFLKSSISRINFTRYKALFYIGLFLFFFILLYISFISPPEDFPTNVVLNIKDKSTLKNISRFLKENNVIRSRVIFESFVVIFGGEKKLDSGDYLFEERLPVFEVARRISYGDRHLAPVKVTIPEGFDVSDMSKTFVSKLPNFNKDNFLKEGSKKEGYLFPDTYFFLTTDKEQDVLRAMGENFEKKISPLLPEMVSSGKPEKDIITMASIIERESKGDVDRGYISGILWRRISLGMPLQVDSDLDTYKNKGLPDAPICSPGLKSIEAAIHPKESSYLYYLHDKEGNIHYARTFEEHKLNKIKYLKNI